MGWIGTPPRWTRWAFAAWYAGGILLALFTLSW